MSGLDFNDWTVAWEDLSSGLHKLTLTKDVETVIGELTDTDIASFTLKGMKMDFDIHQGGTLSNVDRTCVLHSATEFPTLSPSNKFEQWMITKSHARTDKFDLYFDLCGQVMFNHLKIRCSSVLTHVRISNDGKTWIRMRVERMRYLSGKTGRSYEYITECKFTKPYYARYFAFYYDSRCNGIMEIPDIGDWSVANISDTPERVVTSKDKTEINDHIKRLRKLPTIFEGTINLV